MNNNDYFQRALAAANRNPTANFHVFVEFTDGKRGYHSSRETLDAAKRLCEVFDEKAAPIVYDRDGNDVHYGW